MTTLEATAMRISSILFLGISLRNSIQAFITRVLNLFLGKSGLP